METSAKQRLVEYLKHIGIGQNKFEKMANISNGYISNIKGEIGATNLTKILNAAPDLNPAWLLTGEGAMLREDAAQADTASTRKRIPLYNDVASIGGLNGRVADVENASAQVAEWIDAGDWFPEATAAIRHYGDSMVEYPAGSILVLKRVLDMRLLLNGRNYVIETSEFRVTKQLQYDAGNDYLTAYSTNRETYPDGRLVHSPIRIPLETIRHIDLIVGCVQKEFSNGAIPII